MNCSCSIVTSALHHKPDNTWTVDVSHNIEVLRSGVQCVECGMPHRKGARALRFTHMVEGRIHVNHTCLDCLSILREMFPWGHMVSQMWKEIITAIRFGTISPVGDCLVKLTPRARAMVCDEFNAYWRKVDGK